MIMVIILKSRVHRVFLDIFQVKDYGKNKVLLNGF